jgi:hypothetical protein
MSSLDCDITIPGPRELHEVSPGSTRICSRSGPGGELLVPTARCGLELDHRDVSEVMFLILMAWMHGSVSPNRI